MTPPDGLQVLIICHAKRVSDGDFPRPKDFAEVIRQAFIRHETNDLVRELSLVDEHGTGAAVRLFYVDSSDKSRPTPPEPVELDKALHTLVVLLVTEPLVGDDDTITALEKLAAAVESSSKRHSFLVLGSSEGVLVQLRGKPAVKALKEPQGWSVEKLGEYALRPAYAAILALHRARKSVALDATLRGDPKYGDKARFFVSHAKLDGLPLAQAVSHVITQFPWLDQFYDAKDIQPGDDFKEILERGVLGSMLLALRTDIYDLRPWCRQEVLWAEAYDRPVLLVDARTELCSRASVLGFTGIPGVRIPDGNLVRVIMEGLREWVRIGVLRRRFAEVVKPGSALAATTEFLTRPPSLTSLAAAIKRLETKSSATDSVQVVHSEPPLESNHLDAAQKLIKGTFPNGTVLSFKVFLGQLP